MFGKTVAKPVEERIVYFLKHVELLSGKK